MHRLGQIAIGGRLGQQAPKKGQQTVEIELITGPKQGMQGFGEFQHHQLSTRPQNPAQFTQGGRTVGDVAYAESDGRADTAIRR